MPIKWDGAKQQRKNLNMRCTDDLRARVEAAAEASGRSLTEEVLWRVERSFYTDGLEGVVRDAVAVGVTNALMLLDKSSAAEPISSPLPSYAQ